MAEATQIERTAYHEAGHAVAFIEMRLAFKYVTIVPGCAWWSDDAKLGYLQPVAVKGFRPDRNVDRRTRERAEARIIGLLAGSIAEAKLIGQDVPKSGSRVDLDQAASLAKCFCGSDEEVEAYLESLYVRTKQLFDSPHVWAAVEALAGELFKHTRVSAVLARKIVRAAMGLPV